MLNFLFDVPFVAAFIKLSDHHLSFPMFKLIQGCDALKDP